MIDGRLGQLMLKFWDLGHCCHGAGELDPERRKIEGQAPNEGPGSMLRGQGPCSEREKWKVNGKLEQRML